MDKIIMNLDFVLAKYITMGCLYEFTYDNSGMVFINLKVLVESPIYLN